VDERDLHDAAGKLYKHLTAKNGSDPEAQDRLQAHRWATIYRMANQPVPEGRLRFFIAGLLSGLVLGIVIAAATKAPASVLASKLLDWPFLLFCGLLLFTLLFFGPLHGLLGRGDILVSWGEGKSIRLRDLSKKLDQEFDPVHGDIDELRSKVEQLQRQAGQTSSASDAQVPDVRERILDALKNGKWRWRSLEALSDLAGLSEQQTLEILRSERDVVLSRGKSGRRIARHRLR
jgi:ElaB/YqjD/DUF883 family membrane-anchored ribosome-binding protein